MFPFYEGTLFPDDLQEGLKPLRVALQETKAAVSLCAGLSSPHQTLLGSAAVKAGAPLCSCSAGAKCQ